MRLFPVQKLVALSLIIFLSGTCCLLCCETMKAAPSDTASAEESCPLGKGHHCCPKAPKTGDKIALSPAISSGAEKCCPFISKRSDLARKTETEQKTAALVPLKISAPVNSFARYSFIPVNSYRSVIRNRGSTYLANCVFRI